MYYTIFYNLIQLCGLIVLVLRHITKIHLGSNKLKNIIKI